MKRLVPLLLTVLVFTVPTTRAQQDKQLTHYAFDRISFNPAATGFEGYCGTLIYRSQWDNKAERAPNTTLLNAQASFPKQNLGVGLSIANDVLGFLGNNTLVLNGAYHLPLNPGTLSAGIGVGLLNIGISPKWAPPQTINDPSLMGASSGTTFDINIGLYWRSEGAPYYVGLSATHLSAPSVGIGEVKFPITRNYYLIGGYDLLLSDLVNWETKVLLKPSILLKLAGSSAVIDVNVMGDYWLNNASYLWGGLSYRRSDAFALQMGYAFSPSNNIDKTLLKIGYSFDVVTNPMGKYGRISHELMLDFCLFPPKPSAARSGNPFILQ